MNYPTAKFERWENKAGVPHAYDDTYYIQRERTVPWMEIGPSCDAVGLLLNLAAALQGPPWVVLYVLVLSRTGAHEVGRYQSPMFETLDALNDFVNQHKAFLEGDGRHNLWIATPYAPDGGQIVYDRHGVLYAYGPLDRFENILTARGFRPGPVTIPVPHAHHYHDEFDAQEVQIMATFNWVHSPLREGDE
jgi:hypothetical protein